jgi:hypothetical protein
MSTCKLPKKKPTKPCLDWGLERLAFPPPTFEEAPPERPKMKGLFQEMLQADPHQLLPFVEGTKEHTLVALLIDLLGKTRSLESLHPEERMQLDDATMRMLTEPSQKRRVNKPFEYVKKKVHEVERDVPPPTVDGLVPFWWL